MENRKQRTKRGYPVAFLIAFISMRVIYYKIYSERIESFKNKKLARKYTNMEKNQKYHLFEEILTEIRPVLQSGLKSILLVSRIKQTEASDFLHHLKKHHKWIFNVNNPNSAYITVLTGDLTDMEQVASFTQNSSFKESLGQTVEKEVDSIITLLEKRLNNHEKSFFLHSLKEIESLIYAGGTRKKKFKSLPLIPEYILLTDEYLEEHPNKARLQRLLQIVRNRKIRLKIISSESSAGNRLTDLGGIICFLEIKTKYEEQKAQEFFD